MPPSWSLADKYRLSTSVNKRTKIRISISHVKFYEGVDSGSKDIFCTHKTYALCTYNSQGSRTEAISMNFSHIQSIIGVSHIPTLNTTYDCVRTFTTDLPFIGTSQTTCILTPKLEKGKWVGVQCIHKKGKQSPHLTGTHIESSRHIIGDAQPLSTILKSNPHYLKKMEGLHIKVQHEEQYVTEIQHSGTDQQCVRFSSGETYNISINVPLQSLEKVVTKKQLQKAIGNQCIHAGSMLLLQFEGCDDEITNWPYLTNEAMQFLFDCKISLLALNIPSCDREKDGGKTSNHKLFLTIQIISLLNPHNCKNCRPDQPLSHWISTTAVWMLIAPLVYHSS